MNYIFEDVLGELAKAKMAHPIWPSDPLHALAILGEEYGELIKAIVEHVYEAPKSSLDDVRKEALQTAATAIRWLENFDSYEFKEGDRK